MRINDFEKMQQNLDLMKRNLDNIERTNISETKRKRVRFKDRHAVEKKINRIEHPKITRIAEEEQMIVKITIAIVAVTFVFSTSIFARTVVTENSEESESIEAIEENVSEENFNVEKNENAIELENILMENVSILKSKEYAEEIRPVEFETEYTENPKLPENEEVITSEGQNGTEQVTVIKSFENNVLVAENVLETISMESAIPQKVDKGTSKFLAEKNIHIDDKIYLKEEANLKSEANKDSEDICTILSSLDVILVDLIDENWAQIEYEGLEGYIETSSLTSETETPEIVEKNRIQKIKMTLSEDIQLNQSTDLTLEDYRRILEGNSADKKNIIAENAEVFYNIDKNYNMNGIFLAAMAIHESGWGTSTIADEKKNLFGYGAYDSSPYESSFSFESYAEGIDLVAKVLVKYYINEEGTSIYNDEIAKGSYYNGSTIADVNIRYASDQEWHNKIYKYMKYLYNRL